jgi:hypothetical protein
MFTQMFQSSCFMGQWFLFVSQLLQMLLRLCLALFALLYDTAQSESSLALKMVALRLRYFFLLISGENLCRDFFIFSVINL